MFEGGGHDVLGHVVQPVGKLAAPGSPSHPEELVASPTEQPCLGGQRLVERDLVPLFEVVAPKVDEPAAEPEALLTVWVLDHSVERDVLRAAHHDLSHFGSPSLALSATTDADATTRGEWAGMGRPVRGSVGVDIEVEMEKERRDSRVVTADLISRARAGDGDAFRTLVEPYRRELQVHCYRMLGSFQDAEDALQDTLLAAWQGLGGFERRASIRTWLYRIATNRCLNARRSTSRRPAKEWDVPEVEPPEPTRLGEVAWLEPFPDALLEGASEVPLGPEARYEQIESISLAFVTALQVLPPRQLAVLVLRDVLGLHASEVADMLDSSVESVNSALKRARAGLHR